MYICCNIRLLHQIWKLWRIKRKVSSGNSYGSLYKSYFQDLGCVWFVEVGSKVAETVSSTPFLFVWFTEVEWRPKSWFDNFQNQPLPPFDFRIKTPEVGFETFQFPHVVSHAWLEITHQLFLFPIHFRAFHAKVSITLPLAILISPSQSTSPKHPCLSVAIYFAWSSPSRLLPFVCLPSLQIWLVDISPPKWVWTMIFGMFFTFSFPFSRSGL